MLNLSGFEELVEFGERGLFAILRNREIDGSRLDCGDRV